MADELIGKTIGGYEIQDVIGRGGMATVFRAHQVSMNRSVAMKVLPEQYVSDDTYIQRFNQEVAIVAKLEHRNIVPVHDYGEYNGQPYIVMRYMSGGSVDDLLKNGPLELETVANIVEQIAPALDYAHSKNVLHRDLKPSNVLLDDDGGAYLTDFGIARVLGEQAHSGITTQGVVGTPSYMSPEQAQGMPLDGRSDIYALGVMLFELVTGRRPFESDTPYGIAVLQVTTPPPSPRSLNPILSFAVEEVIYKALRKKREERFPNAVALAEALKRALNKPVMSMHDTQPNFQRPSAPEPSPPPVQQVASAPPPVAYSVPMAPVTPNPATSGYTPGYVQQPRRKKRPGNIWASAALGGLIGCGLLALVVLIVTIVVSNINQRANEVTTTQQGPSTADGSGDAQSGTMPTLDPTSAAGRSTLIPPTRTPLGTPEIAPVGVRATEGVGEALQAIGGTLVYFDQRDGNYEVYKIDLASGAETQLTTDSDVDDYPAVSPDGTMIAFQSDRDGDFDIYLMDMDGGNVRKLTDNNVLDNVPGWTPDGEQVIFSSDTRNDGTFDVYAINPDGSGLTQIFSNNQRNSHPRFNPDMTELVFTTGTPRDSAKWEIGHYAVETDTFRLLTDNASRDRSPAYSPDGSTILFLTGGINGGTVNGDSALAVMDADGSNARILYDGVGLEWGADYSPDGRYISFTSVSPITGRDEVFVMNADGTNILQVTSDGGQVASWVP
ncbi:MAG: serine/threonine-protein kinase [Chloroflexi bacterium]|nr:serine/threonine-protein kinase [Chloroflexota bacterium]MCC6894224.1 serine/threonine-protein kinase [Anaerolineae bacterium]